MENLHQLKRYISIPKAWNAIDRLSIKWKTDLSEKAKRNFFQVMAVSAVLIPPQHGRNTKRKSYKGITHLLL